MCRLGDRAAEHTYAQPDNLSIRDLIRGGLVTQITPTPSVETAAPTRLKTTQLSPNGALVKRVYDAFANQDFDAIVQQISSDAVFVDCAGSPTAGTYEGSDEIASGFFAPISQMFSKYTWELTDLIDGGDRIVARCNYKATGNQSGKAFNVRATHIWTIASGSIIALEQVLDTAPVAIATGTKLNA